MKRAFASLIMAVLGACSATGGTPPEEYVWARTDGQRMAGNQQLKVSFDRDLYECQLEVVSASNGTSVKPMQFVDTSFYQKAPPTPDWSLSSPNYGNFLAGAAQSRAVNQQIMMQESLMQNCIRVRGYVYGPRSGF